jgi:hypothetical protein
MKTILHVMLAIAVTSGLAGCASTRAYFVDRGRDAVDIVTLTAGTGLGAKAKAGPFATGLMFNGDVIGLRGGESFATLDYEALDIWFPVPLLGELGWICGLEEWDARDPDPRHKSFGHTSCCPLVISDLFGDKKSSWATPYPYQFELGIGLGLSLHAGINPAELADFIVGWFALDLFNDDLVRTKSKNRSNQPSQPIAGKPGSG